MKTSAVAVSADDDDDDDDDAGDAFIADDVDDAGNATTAYLVAEGYRRQFSNLGSPLRRLRS